MQLFDVSLPVLRETDDQASVIDYEHRREDLTVQVRLAPQGLWHKKAIGGLHTACGDPIIQDWLSLREETYAGDMCPTCFTQFERKGGTPRETQPDPPFTPLKKRAKK